MTNGQSATEAAVAEIDTTDRRRLLGSYYTPDLLAQIVVRWALRGQVGTVLDPSYGGCSFLRAAIKELELLGDAEPHCRIFGAEIDTSTKKWTAELERIGVPAIHLHRGDFLKTEPGRAIPRCDAVVGNPPYIRHHWLSDDTMARSAPMRARAGLSARASMWAYFLLHSTGFVAPNGRMAMLLPGAVLHADYAQEALSFVAKHFQSVELVRLSGRFFEDASEETVILLASGRTESPTPMQDARADVPVQSAASLDNLRELLGSWHRSRPKPRSMYPASWVDCVSPYKLDLMGRSALTVLRRVLDGGEVFTLGEVADVRIGVVTGANDFFVRALADVPPCEGVRGVSAVRTGAWLRSPRWTKADQVAAGLAGKRSSLLAIDPDCNISREHALASSVARAEEAGVHQRHHCSVRKPWWSLNDTRAPDVFLPYMRADAPHLALNEVGATCTNAVHRVDWRLPVSSERAHRIVASSWSTLFSLSAELVGRHYGGGVLKVEPRAARSLLVADFGDADLLQTIDGVARRPLGNPAAITACDRVARGALRLSASDMRLLREAVGTLRSLRNNRR